MRSLIAFATAFLTKFLFSPQFTFEINTFNGKTTIATTITLKKHTNCC